MYFYSTQRSLIVYRVDSGTMRTYTYCLSSYVKSAVVSGNDNEQIVTGEVERLAGFYPALKLLAAIYVIFLLFLTFKQVLFW